MWECYKGILINAKFNLYKLLVISIIWVTELNTPGWGRKKGCWHLRTKAPPYLLLWAQNQWLCMSKFISLVGQKESLATIKHQVSWSVRPSFKVDTSRDDNAKSGQTTSKSGQTWQCWNPWEQLPTDHPGGDCLVS